MKKLTNLKITSSGGKFTMTADVSEADPNDFRFPARQTTEMYQDMNNPTWMRHIQISNKAIFVKAFGNAFVLLHDDLVKIATAVEPKTSYPPFFRPKAGGLQVELCSELEPDLQWQVSNAIGKDSNWANVEGQTSGVLDVTKVKKGQLVRLVASSEAGTMISTAAQVK